MSFEARLDELTPEQRELLDRLLKKERLHLASATAYRAPATAMEEALVAIWSELLHVDPGVDDNYFELGGDSLTVIRMVSLARTAGLDLRAEWVFSHPTIAGLAARLHDAAPIVAAPPADSDGARLGSRVRAANGALDRALTRQQAHVVDAYPLTPAQQGLLYHTLERPLDGRYVVQWRFRIGGPLDVPRLRGALADVVARHDALRTIFQVVDVDEPLQLVLDRAETSIVEEQAGDDWPARAAEMFDEERRRAFDLWTPPLMRIRFLRIADDDRICFWTHHHLILDGWAQQLFLKELFTTYRGQPLPPVRAGAFREHVQHVRSVDEIEAAAFWRRELDGFQPPPADLPAGTGSVHAALTRSVPCDGALRDALKRCGVTLSVLYEAAWALALARLTGRRDIVFGIACSGRSAGALGVEDAVGLFMNTVPMRLRVDPSTTLDAFLQTTRDTQGRLVAHEACGLASVQRWIGWPPGARLIDALYVSEPAELDLSDLQAVDGLAIGGVEATTHEHFPLVCVTQDEGEVTRVTLKHLATTGVEVRRLEQALDLLVSIPRFCATPGMPLREILDATVSAL